MEMRNLIILVIISAIATAATGQKPADITHTIAAIEKDRFHGWPANNGVWQWGDEILVGFTQGDYAESSGHNITGIEESKFSRSKDGGITWTMFDPENFLDDENIKWLPKGKKQLEAPINFRHEGFAIRFFASGYHGNDDPEGGFYYSYDRGTTWNGPYFLAGLNEQPELKNKGISARTDYLVLGEKELIFFTSASNGKVNRIACIRTRDGGMSFQFVSWVTPEDNMFSAIMPATVRISEQKFVLSYRKIYPFLKNTKGNMIESYVSEDGCKTWKYLSNIKFFESSSNPPALIKLQDGRLLCVYGDRHHSRMAGKYSRDAGATWGEEFILRDNFKDANNSAWDFGYPRLVQRTDGKVVSMYYWATEENPQQFIAVSIWDPKN